MHSSKTEVRVATMTPSGSLRFSSSTCKSHKSCSITSQRCSTGLRQATVEAVRAVWDYMCGAVSFLLEQATMRFGSRTRFQTQSLHLFCPMRSVWDIRRALLASRFTSWFYMAHLICAVVLLPPSLTHTQVSEFTLWWWQRFKKKKSLSRLEESLKNIYKTSMDQHLQ